MIQSRLFLKLMLSMLTWPNLHPTGLLWKKIHWCPWVWHEQKCCHSYILVWFSQVRYQLFFMSFSIVAFNRYLLVHTVVDAYKPFSFCVEGKGRLDYKEEVSTQRVKRGHRRRERESCCPLGSWPWTRGEKNKMGRDSNRQGNSFFERQLACSCESLHSPCIDKNRAEVSHQECLGFICFFPLQTGQNMILNLAVVTKGWWFQ